MDYIRPGRVDKVIDLLAEGETWRYKLYAGGTDVMPNIKNGSLIPRRSLFI